MYVKLGGKLDASGFEAFSARVYKSKADMDGAEKQFVASSGRMAKAAKLMAVGTAAAGAAVGVLFVSQVIKAGKVAADFQGELKRFEARSGATAKEMRAVRRAALDLGTDMGVGARKAAQAATELAKGGLSVTQIVKGGLSGALALMVAGEMDAAAAAETVANALNLFKLSGEDAAHVADALATAANATTADVKDFAIALSQGGGAAKAAGLDFDQTIAWLESLAQAGVKGSDAGTSLKTTLVQLASPTKQQAEATKKLGLDFFDAHGAMKPLPAVADMLRDKLGGLTKEQRLNALSTIAGTDGMRALLALYDSGGPKVEKLERGLKKQGSAAATAAKQNEGAAGASKKLGAAWEQAQILFGEQLLPAFADGATQITDKLKELAADGSLAKFGQDVAGVVASVATNLPTIIKIGDALFKVFDWFALAPVRGLTAIFNAMLDPILGFASTAIDAFREVAAAMDSIVPGDQSGIVDTLDKASNSIDRLRQNLAHGDLKIKFTMDDQASAQVYLLADRLTALGRKQLAIKITTNAQSAEAAIAGMRAALAGVPDRLVVGILTNAKTAAVQVDAFTAVAMGVPPTRVLRILQNAPTAGAQVAAMIAITNGVPSRKVLTILQNAPSAQAAIDALSGAIFNLPSSKTITITTLSRRVDEVLKNPGKHQMKAQGGRTSGPELAWIGEGRDPVEWVIPRDPAYRGRAIGLLMDAAKSILPGHKRGTKSGPKRIVPAPPKDFRVGDPEEMRGDITTLEGIQDDKIDPPGKAKPHLSKRALEARRELRALRPVYRRTKALADKIDADDERAHNAYSAIQLADKQGKQGEFDKQLKLYQKHLKAEKGGLESIYGALGKVGKTDTKYGRSVLAKLLDIGGNIEDAKTTEMTQADETPAEKAAREASERLADTGMTDPERARLAEIEAAVALAALTPDLGDDRSAAGAKVSFLESILAAVQSDPSRGGNANIASLAGDLKTARDNLDSLTGGSSTNVSADTQAQIDQAFNRGLASGRSDTIDKAAALAFGGPGSGGGVTQNIYTLHPGDSRTLRAVGGAAAAGFDVAGFRRPQRVQVGPR